jgi:hypothetical protein
MYYSNLLFSFFRLLLIRIYKIKHKSAVRRYIQTKIHKSYAKEVQQSKTVETEDNQCRCCFSQSMFSITEITFSQ